MNRGKYHVYVNGTHKALAETWETATALAQEYAKNHLNNVWVTSKWVTT